MAVVRSPGPWRHTGVIDSLTATGDGPPPPRAERLRHLLDVGRSLAAELDLDTVLARVLQTARELSGAQFAALGVVGDDRNALEQVLTDGEEPEGLPAARAGPQGRPLLGRPASLRVSEVTTDPLAFGFPADHPVMRSFLGTSIVVRGQAWGSLYVANKATAAQFDEDDIEAIVVLAEWAAIAIDNARLFGTSERRRVDLERAVGGMEAARDVALALGGETDLDRVLELIAERARALVAADALLIWLAEGDVLRLAAHAGSAIAPVGATISLDRSTSGTALRAGSSVRVDDLSADGLLVDPATFGVETATSALLVPLTYRGRGLGVLTAFDHVGGAVRFSEDDELALRSFAASAATAVATAKTVEAKRLRDSIAAAEAERRRWARDLHDETLQGLGAVKLALAAIRRDGPQSTHQQIGGAITQLEREIVSLRDIIADLRPPALDELGLAPALRTLATRVSAAQGFELDFSLDPSLEDRRLDADVETIAYRVAQEALTNVGKHAAATHVRVELLDHRTSLQLTVRDDGSGVGAPAPTGVGGYGVIGMRERAELGGGTLDLDSQAGSGTTVTLTLPLRGPDGP